MITLTYDLTLDTIKLSAPAIIKLGADVPVRLTFSAAPGEIGAGDLQLALGTDATPPAVLAFTEDFTSENATTWTALLDCTDERLAAFMSGKGPATVKVEVVAVIDGARRASPSIDATVQPAIISGPETSEGGPAYYTEAQTDAAIAAAFDAQIAEGAVVATAGQDLSGAQRAQARQNVAAASVVNGLVPAAELSTADPQANITLAIDDRIAGLTANSSTKNLYSTYDHATPSYVRSTTCWLAGVDTSAVSVWNSATGDGKYAVTAVTPTHVIAAHHVVELVNGVTVRFLGNDGAIVTRTLVDSLNPSGDLRVWKLNAALPDTVVPVRVAASAETSRLGLSTWLLPALFFNQTRKVLVGNWIVTSISQASGNSINLTQRAAFWEGLVLGDSSCPACLLLDGRLVLLWAATSAGPPASGARIDQYIAAIESAIATLGGGGTLDKVSPAETMPRKVYASSVLGLGAGAVMSVADGEPDSDGLLLSTGLSGEDVPTLECPAHLRVQSMPASDPGVAGVLWNDSGTVKISAG
jgi:hypothetical protein